MIENKSHCQGDGGEEGSNYVQGCMEEIRGENIDCGMLHIAAWRGGDSGAKAAGAEYFC